MKIKEKEKARYLRGVEGKSVGEISKILDCSKGSVSCWVRDVKLTKSQVKELDRRNPASKNFTGNRVAAYIVSSRARDVRIGYQQEGRQMMKIADHLFVSGCMLYWAEGAKCRNSLKFTNTDSAMMALFLKFLKECFNIDNNKLTLYCRSHVLSTQTLDQVENYWVNKLGLNNSCLRKGTIEIRIPKRKKVKYHNGICTLCLHNTQILQKVYGAIKEYAGIDDEELWLF